MWTWSADPIANEVARAAGANPVPLGVPDVLPSLNTGLVDGFYTSPLAAIALQWFTKVEYMTNEPVAMLIGASVVSNDVWNALSADEQKILERVSDKWHRILVKKVRQDNAKSLELLKGQGIEMVELSAADRAAWRRLAETVQTNLTGKVYPEALLRDVKKLAESK
jgi:TRAP-type C4-dicarboxylate transport system substrate-binding protein